MPKAAAGITPQIFRAHSKPRFKYEFISESKPSGKNHTHSKLMRYELSGQSDLYFYFGFGFFLFFGIKSFFII